MANSREPDPFYSRLAATSFFVTTLILLVALIYQAHELISCWEDLDLAETPSYPSCNLAAPPFTTPQDENLLFVVVRPKESIESCLLDPNHKKEP